MTEEGRPDNKPTRLRRLAGDVFARLEAENARRVVSRIGDLLTNCGIVIPKLGQSFPCGRNPHDRILPLHGFDSSSDRRYDNTSCVV